MSKTQYELEWELRDAIDEGNLKQVLELLQQGENPNTKSDTSELIPLFQTLVYRFGEDSEFEDESEYFDHLNMLNAFIKAGVNLEDTDAYENTALLVAIKNQNLQITKFLLDVGAAVNYDYKHLYSPLLVAAESGNLDITYTLMQAGADASALYFSEGKTVLDMIEHSYSCKDNFSLKIIRDGYSPLHIAIENGNIEAFEIILKDNPEYIDSQDNNGRTPLHFAVILNQPSLVYNLLLAGADTSIADNSERIPHMLIEELYNDDKRIAFKLEESFAKGIIHNTELHCATEEGDIETITSILESIHNIVNAQNAFGSTALHLAAEKGHGNIVILLMENSADPLIKDSLGRVACDRAKLKGQKSVVEMLDGYEDDLPSASDAATSNSTILGSSDHYSDS